MHFTKPLVIDHNEYKAVLKKQAVSAQSGQSLRAHDAASCQWPVHWDKPHTVWVAHDTQLIHAVKDMHASAMLVVVLRSDALSALDGIALEHLAAYFESKRLVLVLGTEAEALAQALSDLINIDAFTGWQPIVDKALLDQDVDYFRVFYRSLAAKINIKNLYKATKIQTAYLFLRNALINAPLASRATDLQPFHNAQLNKPVLIVAAGPSLNKQLPTLARYQHVFTILAVDTVWPILQKNGIVADMIFALDARSKPSWPKDGVSGDTCFAVDIGCAPALVWSHGQNHLFSTTSASIRHLLQDLGVHTEVLATGGSVATTAFGFARHLGANPVVLIGQDLALTGGKDHADGYLHAYKEDFLKARTDKGFDVEGYYGDRVKTEKQLLFYKTWYENQIASFPETLVINATEGGAKIAGSLQIPFLQVCQELEAFQKAKDFQFPRHEMRFDAAHLAQLSIRLGGLIDKTREFIELAHQGELLIDRKGPRSRRKLLLGIDRLNDQLMSFDEDARFVVDAFSQVKMTQISYQTVTDTRDKTLDIAIGQYRKIYMGIQESGHLALAMLQEISALYGRLSERKAYDPDLLNALQVTPALPTA